MARLLSAYGYQGDAMNLPVADVESAPPVYACRRSFSIFHFQLSIVIGGLCYWFGQRE